MGAISSISQLFQSGDPYNGTERRYRDTGSFRYWGNYCGPNYSAGKYDADPLETLNGHAIDELDDACKTHDLYYTLGMVDEGDAQLHYSVKDNYNFMDALQLNWNLPNKIAAGALGRLNKTQATVLLDQGFQGKVAYESNIGSINRPSIDRSKVTPAIEERIKKYLDARTLPSNDASLTLLKTKKATFNPFSVEEKLFPGVESVSAIHTEVASPVGVLQPSSGADPINGAETTDYSGGKAKKGKSCGCGCGSAKMQGGDPRKGDHDNVNAQQAATVTTPVGMKVNPIMAYRLSDMLVS